MSISLIANSGIQFHKFDITINPNDDVIKSMGFYEFTDVTNERISLQYAYYLPDHDMWAGKMLLKEEGYLDEQNVLSDNINYNIVKSFSLRDSEYFTISDIKDVLDIFGSNDQKRTWLPIPYFKKNSNQKTGFGPIAWARMMLKDISAPADKIKTFKVILAFDTTVDDESQIYFTPRSSDKGDEDNRFAFSNNEDHNLNFCDAEHDCAWVDNYLKRIVQQGNEPKEFPFLKYLGYYLYLLKYCEALKIFPEVVLHSDEKQAIEVDLVLDIGNANTCGLLCESPTKNKPFQFTSVKKLKLNDLSEPEKDYNEPFSMHLAFMEAKFGEIDIPMHKCFRWPSLVRLGKEASHLVNTFNLDIDKGKETAISHSSPKRYLWDNMKSDTQWEFINYNGSDLRNAIYYEGISEQFKENGDYAYDGDFACAPYYSRKSLMTFVYLEILLQAIAQVNSYEFRLAHGNAEKPRKLKRITITCPTSIIQKEQVVLRECAVEAVRTLSRFFSNTFLGEYDIASEVNNDLEIIPNPKDLAKNLSVISTRKDWIYDEATCGQFVFLYGEISRRYLNNARTFFELYGKKRNDVSNLNEKSLTIGSIDIGGGTTDLMICAYQYEKDQSLAVINPHPLYWESFNLAGDDLLKEVVQQVILEGEPTNADEHGCTGVIQTSAKEKGVTDVAKKMLNFFGQDSNNQGYIPRTYRKNFILQVANPIALRYLQHSVDNLPDREIGYNELFPELKPNADLVNYFNNHFYPLKLEDIKWKLSRKRVASVIETTFDSVLKQLSAIMAAYGCDFVLLAGKPTTLPKVREMFIKYYPVSPDRIIALNNYRVGRWYPFADDIGYFEDPKTIVAVGALIALMGGKTDKLDGFRINTKNLRTKLVATSDYIGVLDRYTQKIEAIHLTPDLNNYDVEVHTMPMTFGYKQLLNRNYRARPIYKLDFNETELRRKVIDQNTELATEAEIARAIETYKTNLKNRMPFRVTIKRNWSESREQVLVDKVKDASNNENAKSILALRPMTLADEYAYWLDTGEFTLNIK